MVGKRRYNYFLDLPLLREIIFAQKLYVMSCTKVLISLFNIFGEPANYVSDIVIPSSPDLITESAK